METICNSCRREIEIGQYYWDSQLKISDAQKVYSSFVLCPTCFAKLVATKCTDNDK